MSATLETTATGTLASQAFVSDAPAPAFGAALRQGLAFARGVLVEISVPEVIEGGALMAVLAAATVFTAGAFGVQIGAN